MQQAGRQAVVSAPEAGGQPLSLPTHCPALAPSPPSSPPTNPILPFSCLLLLILVRVVVVVYVYVWDVLCVVAW